MRDYHINIFYSEDDDGYIADIPDLEACSAFGDTPDEALREVQKARELWLEAARAEGKPIPPPKYRPVIPHIPERFPRKAHFLEVYVARTDIVVTEKSRLNAL